MKTQSEIVAEQNVKAIAKIKQGVQESAELQNAVARGEMTAGEALKKKASKIKKPTAEQLGVSAVVGNRGKTRSTNNKETDITTSAVIAPEIMQQGVRDVLESWYEWSGEQAKLHTADVYAEVRRFDAACGGRWTEYAEKGESWMNFKHRMMLKALRQPHVVSVTIPTPPKPPAPVAPSVVASKPQTVKPATVQPASTASQQYKPRGEGWNGLSASAIGRWMGANGWTKEDAWKVLNKLKIEGVAQGSLPTLIKAGRDGFRVPTISPELVDQLNAANDVGVMQTIVKPKTK